MRRSGLLLPWLILPLLAVVLRFFSFFPSVIDHDESTYLIIGRDVLAGKVYFKDVIDTKPIGIFWLYAFFQALVGESIFWLRAIAAIWIGITSVILFRIAWKWHGDTTAAWATGLIYVFLSSTFTFWGVSPNTEIFFNLFTVTAFYLLLFSGPPGHKRMVMDAVAGFLLGSAFIIKYVALADAAAIGLFVLWQATLQKRLLQEGVGRGVVIVAGFLLPIAGVWLYYWAQGELQTLYFYTFEVTGRYPASITWLERLEFMGDFLLRFLPINCLVVMTLFSKNDKTASYKWLFILWIVLVFWVIVIPGKTFGHYFIQMMPVLSLAAGVAFLLPALQKLRKAVSGRPAWMSGIALVILLVYFQKKDYFDKPDKEKIVLEYLLDQMQPGDQFYTGNYHHILYYLSGKTSISPYVHASLLWHPDHIQALEIDLSEEIKSILAAGPRFILLREPVPESILSDTIRTLYTPVKKFDNRVLIMERNETIR